MSTRRSTPNNSIKDPSGKGYLCSCGCGKKPIAPKRNWFSPECVHRGRMRSDPGYVRQQVFERDKGCCANCGRDVEKLRRRFHRLYMETKGISARAVYPSAHYGLHRVRHLSKWHEVSRFPDLSRSWWDADHIIEVVRGGGECGLDNYQTLCVPCHKTKTARLAGELARERSLEDLQSELFTSTH